MEPEIGTTLLQVPVKLLVIKQNVDGIWKTVVSEHQIASRKI